MAIPRRRVSPGGARNGRIWTKTRHWRLGLSWPLPQRPKFAGTAPRRRASPAHEPGDDVREQLVRRDRRQGGLDDLDLDRAVVPGGLDEPPDAAQVDDAVAHQPTAAKRVRRRDEPVRDVVAGDE